VEYDGATAYFVALGYLTFLIHLLRIIANFFKGLKNERLPSYTDIVFLEKTASVSSLPRKCTNVFNYNVWIIVFLINFFRLRRHSP
jgi:hypothetical protein